MKNRPAIAAIRLRLTLAVFIAFTAPMGLGAGPACAKESAAKELAQKELTPKNITKSPQPAATFQDCARDCPTMIVIPPGHFVMGSPAAEDGRFDDERQHEVRIGYSFAVGIHAVTVGEFAAFVQQTGYDTGNHCWVYEGGSDFVEREGRSWRNPGFAQTDRHPVVCVNYADTQAYLRWLGKKTGHRYRLLSEAEWEYAARAGTTTARYWGNDANQACAYANAPDLTFRAQFSDYEIVNCHDDHVFTAPVGSFKPNAFGLYDMLGNVWQYVGDCYVPDYEATPHDGSPQTDCSANVGEFKNTQVLRGGAWDGYARFVRAAFRGKEDPGLRNNNDGFRIARTL